MLKNVFFLKRSKILVCVFTTLLIFLCLAIIGISYAQSVEETEKMKSIQIINPRPQFSLRLWLDKTSDVTYQPGEKIQIFFQVSRDAYVTLYNYDTEGRVKIIFPNEFSPQQQHNLIKAGIINTIEGVIDLSAKPGIEYIQGFAATRSISLGLVPKVKKDYKEFIHQFRGIIQPLPSTEWVTSDLLSYNITPPPPNYGRVMIMSNPQGAKIYLDNSYKGLTPLNLDNITTGQHSLKMVISGYQEWSSSVSVVPYRTTNVSADLIPQQSYGSISVYSNPQGAKIYLDNVYKGSTPLNLKNISLGQHSLKMVISGYQEWTSYVSVVPYRTTNVSADLIPQQSYGSISVYCDQSGAKIFVNGTYKKTTSSTNPVSLENMEEGYYELTVIKDGFRTCVEDVEVYFGEVSSVNITMTELFK